MAWHWLVFAGAKSHAAPDALYRPLVAEMRERKHRLVPSRSKTTELIAFDYPGAVITTAPRVKVSVDGLTLDVWCDEVALHIANVRALGERRFRGGLSYFKLHGYARCVVMTLLQREELVDALMTVEPESVLRAQDFFARYRKAIESTAGQA